MRSSLSILVITIALVLSCVWSATAVTHPDGSPAGAATTKPNPNLSTGPSKIPASPTKVVPTFEEMMRDAKFAAWYNERMAADATTGFNTSSVNSGSGSGGFATMSAGRVEKPARMTIIDYWPKTIGYLGDFITIVGTNFDQQENTYPGASLAYPSRWDYANYQMNAEGYFFTPWWYEKIRCTAMLFNDQWAMPVRTAYNSNEIRNDIIICPLGKGQVGAAGDTSAVRTFPLHVWLDSNQADTIVVSYPGITQNDNLHPQISDVHVERYEFEWDYMTLTRVRSMAIARCMVGDRFIPGDGFYPTPFQVIRIFGTNLGVRRQDLNYLCIGSPSKLTFFPASTPDVDYVPHWHSYRSLDLAPASSSEYNTEWQWGGPNMIIATIGQHSRPPADFSPQAIYFGWGGPNSPAYTTWLPPNGIGISAFANYKTCPVSGQSQDT